MTTFREKLKEVRISQEEAIRNRVPLTDEELGLSDVPSLAIVARDELTRHIESLMEEFIQESPVFSIHRGFFEGKYSISLSTDEHCKSARGLVEKCYSRITFLLAPLPAENRFEITSKLTVLNRDLPKGHTVAEPTREDDFQALRKFAEDEMLRFAKQYYGERQLIPAGDTVAS